MKTTIMDSEIINISESFVLPPKLESDPSANTFEKWLEKQSAVQVPDVANMTLFIRLMHFKKSPACYLLLTKPDELDSAIMKDSLVIGKLFAWPESFSSISNSDFQAKVESEFLNYIKSSHTPNSIFKRAAGVVVGFSNNDYKALHFK